MKALGVTAASQGPQGVGWAFAVSLAIHGVALAAILWGWGTSSLPEGVPVMDVELVIASPGESGAGKAGPDAMPAAAPPTSAPQTAPPDQSAKTEGATARDKDEAEIPVLLPVPELPPPVQTEDLRPQPPEAASAPVAPPRVEAAPPNAKAATPPPRPSARPAPTPKRSPQVAAPPTPSGSGATDDPVAGSAAAGGGARLMRHVAPVYPALARERGVEGRVVVRLLVGADGVPAEVRVAQSSGFESLDAAALDAVRQWRFEPARRGGVAVAEERLAPVVFRLRR